MRHRKAGLKLNKTASHRQSMFKNMTTSLFKHDRIRTTDVKAKELRRWADHVITLAKRGDLHARRQVMNIIRDKNLVHELFKNAAEKFSNRSSGYTRIVKIGRRTGDAAPISLIELIDSEPAPKDSRKPKTKTTPASTSSVKPIVNEETQQIPTEKAKEPVEKTTESDTDRPSPTALKDTTIPTETKEDIELSKEVAGVRGPIYPKEDSEKSDSRKDDQVEKEKDKN
jgi:large subunit ribosomal protein L17